MAINTEMLDKFGAEMRAFTEEKKVKIQQDKDFSDITTFIIVRKTFQCFTNYDTPR
jgi:hypothetical protein